MRQQTIALALLVPCSLLGACLPPLTTQLAIGVPIFAGELPIVAIPADVNGDGKMDLVATRNWGRGEISVRLGRGDGTFEAPLNIIGNGAPKFPAVVDLNGDGKLDLVVTDFVGGGYLSILLGNGDGTFKEPMNHVVGRSASSAKAGDFNGDGKVDLVVVNDRTDSPDPAIPGATEFLAGKLTVLLGRGDGTFEAARSRALGEAPGLINVGDWNGDGKLDLAVVDVRRRELLILSGRGDGTFQEGACLRVGSDPVGLSAALDLNKDGKPDLTVSVIGGVVVFLGRGDGSFDRGGTYATGPTRSVWAADFDHDGFIDLAAARRILRGDGTGQFSSFSLPHPDYDDSFVAAADFNGDGWPDLAATDLAHNQIHIYLNRGPKPAATASR